MSDKNEKSDKNKSERDCGKTGGDTVYKKNQEYIVVIEDTGTGGEGIAKIDGYTLFIKDAVRGDRCRVRITKAHTNFAYAKLMEVLEPSPYRVEPVCPVSKRCGGCKVMAASYEEQLRFKENKIRNNLEKIGKVTDYEYYPIIGMEEPYHYRNKAQFPIGLSSDGRIISGFYAGRTHVIIENDKCYLGVPENEEILAIIKNFMEEKHIIPYDEVTLRGLIRHVMIRKAFVTGEIMVCIIINGDSIPDSDELVERLLTVKGMTSISLSLNVENTNVIMGKTIKTIYGKPYITDYIHDLQFRISPKSFFQVNPVQTDKLYSKALEFADLTGQETVWDLYCGIGTISLFLARNARKVYGVEIVSDAIRDARINAKLNGISNAEFFVGRSEEVLPKFYEEHGGYADVIVVDPPRKGCDTALLETIVEMAPERVVYVSCDSATLARDVRFLTERGYEVRKVQGVDMFPHSEHVETVVMLSHKKTDSVINVKVEFGEGEGKVPLDNIAKRAEAYKPKERVTYKMIKEYIEAKYGFKVHTAYIAEVKRELGLPMYDAPNAVEELKQPRKHPTAEKVEAIKDALRYFGII